MSPSLDLARRATGRRHGLVDAPVAVPLGAADVPGFHHASVAFGDRSGGGGASRDPRAAAEAAVAETIERWCAVEADLAPVAASAVDPARCLRLADFSLHTDDQRRQPDFPAVLQPAADEPVTLVHDLRTNEPWFAPAALVTLSPDFGALPTSSGLAAAGSVVGALLRAAQELVERDAYVTTWLHGLGGRRVEDRSVDEAVAGALGASAQVYDLTPAWSSHPVAAVSGCVPLAGRPRYSLGLACRASWAAAVDKALAEFLQGTVFVSHHLSRYPELTALSPHEVTDFDRHAVYHSAVPGRWPDLPLHRLAVRAAAPPDAPSEHPGATDADQLEDLLRATGVAGIRFFYRELTSPAANQLGLRVVRVVSPELTPLHHDHRWPFLGGRTGDVGWRYPGAEARRDPGSVFPSPHPHALG